VLEDIAVLTGANPVFESLGPRLESLTLAVWPRKKVSSTSQHDGHEAPAKQEIKGRIESIAARCEFHHRYDK